MSDPFTLWTWTDDPARAAAADAAGVDLIGLDLERLGKTERQAGLGTWVSGHRPEALPAIRRVVSRGRVFVRTDPLHAGSAEQVEAVLAAGAEVLMLPNFTTEDELAGYAALAGGRAEVVPLLERAGAIEVIPAMPRHGVRQFHVGLNDLSIDLGRVQRLSLLVDPVVERIAALARDAGLRFGLGGVARPGIAGLPVPPDLVLAQHPRIGSTGAMLAQTFWQGLPAGYAALAAAVAGLRARIDHWAAAPEAELRAARAELATILHAIETGGAG